MRASLNLFKARFACSKLIYSSMALDGGSIREANDRSQWFLSLCSVTSSMERLLLAGYSVRRVGRPATLIKREKCTSEIIKIIC